MRKHKEPQSYKRNGLKTSTSDEVRQGCLHFFTISQSLSPKSAKCVCSLFDRQRSSSGYQLQTYLPRQTSYLQLLFSFSKTSMVTTNKMIWQALQKRCTRRRRSRNGIFFCECRFFNSFRTVSEHMYGSFDQTCDM